MLTFAALLLHNVKIITEVIMQTKDSETYLGQTILLDGLMPIFLL